MFSASVGRLFHTFDIVLHNGGNADTGIFNTFRIFGGECDFVSRFIYRFPLIALHVLLVEMKIYYSKRVYLLFLERENYYLRSPL